MRRHRHQQDWDEPFQEIRIQLLHQQRPGGRAQEGKQAAAPPFGNAHRPRPRVMHRGAAGTERCLQFIGAQRQPGIDAQTEQHRQSDQSTATRDRIHKTCAQPRRKQQCDLPPFNHHQILIIAFQKANLCGVRQWRYFDSLSPPNGERACPERSRGAGVRGKYLKIKRLHRQWKRGRKTGFCLLPSGFLKLGSSITLEKICDKTGWSRFLIFRSC
jgi:hypothetical protein